MGIPKIQDDELPAGEHLASLHEIERIYGSFSDRRKELMKGLYEATDNLEEAGVKTIWIDGSFITSKKEPNDIDGCWEYTSSVDINMLDPIFLGDRAGMKKKYGLDFFIANYIEAKSGLPFPKFFQKNRDGNSKGIIIVKLGRIV
ncbi:MAG: hypothetical protein GW760_07675 [Legionella sp.]|jgi:hypothetical protein|nr:hypothetical protein [Legionella sp.]